MKKYQGIITAVPFVLSIVLFTIRTFTPSYIDAEGFLHESFYLIPMAYLFLFIGMIMLGWTLIRNIRTNRSK